MEKHWNAEVLKAIAEGEEVQYRPKGREMTSG